jgi:hypothetical protein
MAGKIEKRVAIELDDLKNGKADRGLPVTVPANMWLSQSPRNLQVAWVYLYWTHERMSVQVYVVDCLEHSF